MAKYLHLFKTAEELAGKYYGENPVLANEYEDPWVSLTTPRPTITVDGKTYKFDGIFDALDSVDE